MPVSPNENMGAVVQCSGPIGVCGAMSNYWSCAKVVHYSAERCQLGFSPRRAIKEAFMVQWNLSTMPLA